MKYKNTTAVLNKGDDFKGSEFFLFHGRCSGGPHWWLMGPLAAAQSGYTLGRPWLKKKMLNFKHLNPYFYLFIIIVAKKPLLTNIQASLCSTPKCELSNMQRNCLLLHFVLLLPSNFTIFI